MKTLTTKIYLLLTLTLVTSATYAIENIIAPPDNDLIENAIDLNRVETTSYNESGVNFPEATNTNDQTYGGNGCNLQQAAIWYKFTATKAGNVAAGILNPDGAVVVFFSGPANATSGQNLIFVNQNNNICGYSPLGNINTTAGTTYYLYMRNLQVSDITINTAGAFQVPSNDLIVNATDIAQVTQPLFDENVHFLVTTATNDGGQTGCTTGNFDGVWYKITPNASGTIEALMEGSIAGESAMVFYSAPNANASSGTELTWVDQPTNPCGLFNTASIEAEVGVTYYLFAFSIQPYANVIINASNALGVSDNVIEGFSFYPNPVTSEINLNAKNSIDEVAIFNMLGQKVYAENPNASNKNIDLSFLRSGLYVMYITSEGKSASYKIVKE